MVAPTNFPKKKGTFHLGEKGTWQPQPYAQGFFKESPLLPEEVVP